MRNKQKPRKQFVYDANGNQRKLLTTFLGRIQTKAYWKKRSTAPCFCYTTVFTRSYRRARSCSIFGVGVSVVSCCSRRERYNMGANRYTKRTARNRNHETSSGYLQIFRERFTVIRICRPNVYLLASLFRGSHAKTLFLALGAGSPAWAWHKQRKV